VIKNVTIDSLLDVAKNSGEFFWDRTEIAFLDTSIGKSNTIFFGSAREYVVYINIYKLTAGTNYVQAIIGLWLPQYHYVLTITT
jgi:hypothetical protein